MHPSIISNLQQNGSRFYKLILQAGILIGLFFGTWGYLIYGEGQMSFSSAVYYAVQLFFIHMPHLEGYINWQLDLGRWAAAISSSMAVVLILHRAFLVALLPLANKHVVVCGLGEFGTLLALDFKKSGSKVVAIEHDDKVPGVAEAESHGITIVIGNAKDPDTLRKARAQHAKYVLAVCSDDDTNIAIAVAAKELAKTENSAPKDAKCLLLLADSNLREKVTPHLTHTGETEKFQIMVGGFDMPDMVTRMAFEEHPLDFDGIHKGDTTRVHLVIVGTGQLAEVMAVKAVQLCNFANRSLPRLTVIGNDAQGLLDRLKMRHPYASRPLYDATPVNCDRNDPKLPENVAALLRKDELVTVAICPESGCDGDVESQNVGMALSIKEALQENSAKNTQILLYLRRKSGFGKLFESMRRSGNGISIYAFGLIEILCNRDTLLHEKQDCLARSMHLEYIEEQDNKKKEAKAKGEKFVPRPAHRPWTILPEGMRESNRLAADHLAVKLRAIGYRMDIPEKKGAYLFCWEKIPGNDNERLIEFLMQKFGIEWIKAAKIKKNDDGKIIKITYETKFLSLTLNDEKTNVILEIDNYRTDKFIVKIEKDELNIYTGVINSFPDPGDTLAMMEHERWCVERWLDGWRLGDRNDKEKTHPDLKPWDELTDEEKNIDQNFVKKTVDIVKRAKMAIYPISPKNE